MKDQSRNVADPDSVRIRSFAVEAFVGHRATGWPFARFDISSSELHVRLSFPWFTTRSQQATAIRAVIVTRRLGNMYWIGFDDANRSLRDVRVHAIYRRQQIIDELRRCGYHVVGDTGPGARSRRWHWRHS
jgi:hypothetical protein